MGNQKVNPVGITWNENFITKAHFYKMSTLNVQSNLKDKSAVDRRICILLQLYIITDNNANWLPGSVSKMFSYFRDSMY